jgi:hypothetical protein
VKAIVMVMGTAAAKPWTSLVGGGEVTRTLIMTMTMLTINVDDACQPVLPRRQHLGTIIVSGIRSPCVAITESLLLQGNDGDGWWAIMTTTVKSTMRGGQQ